MGGSAIFTTIEGGSQLVYSGASATSTTINSGYQNVSSGGSATATTINNGGSQTVFGEVNSTNINSGGYQHVSGGGSAFGTIISGGAQYVSSGGTATTTTINGGFQDVSSGGTATATTITSGGEQRVSSGGIASDTAIYSDGAQVVFDGLVTETKINSGGLQGIFGGSVTATTINHGGSQHIYVSGAADVTTINSGGEQRVSSGGLANSTTINNGGRQRVYAGGQANFTNINSGGEQRVTGTATETIIRNDGIQNIHSGGIATSTTINSNGNQYVSSGGTALNTNINSGGAQHVSSGGSASSTTISSGGKQHVLSGGTATLTTINGGQSWLKYGAVADGETKVSSGGELLMDAGALATDVNIQGGTLSVNDLSDATYGTDTAQVDKLTMNGGNVNFLRNSDGQFAKLTIMELNGTGNFLLNTSLADRKGNFVTIEQGTGQFGIAVADSGKEISDHTDLTLNLIHEKGGDIDFEMVTASGRSTRFVDGGTYMYTLYSQQDKDGLTGGNVWYLGAMDDGGENPGGENPGGETPGGENPGGENPGGETPGGENPGGENPGGENPGGETPGGENPGGETPGGETPGGENPGGETPGGENPGGETPGGENPGGENPGGENPGGENPGGENPGGGDNGNAGGNGSGGKKPMTTPATDAILAMSNAGLNVIHSELDGLRTYRASLDKAGPESNVWGHYLGSRNDIDTSNGAAYQLSQNGMEIGADTRTDFAGGSLVTGAFMSFSDNKVKHARGGTSKIDSYGLGLYATWYDASGFYADGVVKGNRLNNKLRAVMTNGGRTGGDWTQYALSTAVEGGYQFDLKNDASITPYARMAFVQMTSEDVKLSNGMKGNTGTPRSVTGEAGAKIAGKFNIGSTEFKPYLSAAVLQEFANSNEVTINERNHFDNNVKGTSGKYGLGASVNVGKDVTLYGEANYRQGSQIETPIQGVAGIRIGF
ncbi:autotransporter outer membrane beta-barrel domain-containing protein [Enterobacter bugandensis]